MRLRACAHRRARIGMTRSLSTPYMTAIDASRVHEVLKGTHVVGLSNRSVQLGEGIDVMVLQRRKPHSQAPRGPLGTVDDPVVPRNS